MEVRMLDRALVRTVARDALTRVFGHTVVDQLRPDSPLIGTAMVSSVGMVPADAIAVADAVEQRAAREGARCRLGNETFASDAEGDATITLADLEAGIAAAWVGEGHA